MKINNIGVKSTAAAQTQASELEKNLSAKGKKEAAQSAAPLGSSKVEMSSQAQAFQKAKAIASDDSIDEAKVARLQKLIDEGNYRVDAEAVAGRLVDEHLMVGE